MIDEKELYEILRTAPWFRQLLYQVDPSTGAAVPPGAPRVESPRGYRALHMPRLVDADPKTIKSGMLWQRADRGETRYVDDDKTYTILSSILLAVYDDTSEYSATAAEVSYKTAGTRRWAAQGFEPEYTDEIGRVDVYIYRSASPGALKCYIYSDSSGPSSSLGATGTVNSSEISTSAGWVSLNFVSPISVTAGTRYYIVLESTSVSLTGVYYWAVDSDSPSYSGGQVYTKTGTDSWTAQSWDAMFRVWSPGGGGGGTGGGGTTGPFELYISMGNVPMAV